MWQEPIVNHRIKTAIEEGLTSQSVGQVKRVHRRRDSFRRRFFRSIYRLWKKGAKKIPYHPKATGFRQSRETSI